MILTLMMTSAQVVELQSPLPTKVLFRTTLTRTIKEQGTREAMSFEEQIISNDKCTSILCFSRRTKPTFFKHMKLFKN